MASLEQRLERLEAGDGSTDVMACSWNLEGEPQAAKCGGVTVVRQEGESRTAFIQRAVVAGKDRLVWLE